MWRDERVHDGEEEAEAMPPHLHRALGVVRHVHQQTGGNDGDAIDLRERLRVVGVSLAVRQLPVETLQKSTVQ